MFVSSRFVVNSLQRMFLATSRVDFSDTPTVLNKSTSSFLTFTATLYAFIDSLPTFPYLIFVVGLLSSSCTVPKIPDMPIMQPVFVPSPQHRAYVSNLIVSDHWDNHVESVRKVSARWPAVANVADCCPVRVCSLHYFSHVHHAPSDGISHVTTSVTCLIHQQVFSDCLQLLSLPSRQPPSFVSTQHRD